jgi:hypothetical protein
MSITFELPPEIERTLRDRVADFDAQAKESALVEMYRQGRLTHSELAEALGLSRYQVDGVLKRHGVVEDLLTLDEFRQELKYNDGAAGT